MSNKFKVAVLASGRGSNLKALIDNQNNYQISAVLSDKSEAYALEIAAKAQIPVIGSFPRNNYSNKAEQKQAIYAAIENLQPDLICLAGFMQIIEADFADRHFGKIINIHPSLLPKFTGLDTHERALEAKETLHGCSVHFVDAGLDTGPLIVQGRCPVLETDTPETLAARVLIIEHKIYPWAVNGLASKEITLTADKNARFSERLLKEASLNKFSPAV